MSNQVTLEDIHGDIDGLAMLLYHTANSSEIAEADKPMLYFVEKTLLDIKNNLNIIIEEQTKKEEGA